ncbi:MAG: hypothetical protein EOP81_00715 [Variovorax sp.]|nr:MAG: hypothetical protein EOP81_00715 [Variovorax sp.]
MSRLDEEPRVNLHGPLEPLATAPTDGGTETALLRLALLTCIVLLSACQGTNDVTGRNCVPLRVPAKVALMQEAGLYTANAEKAVFLQARPRNSANDSLNGMRLLRKLSAGTQLEIDRLQQRWGFDSGKGRISAMGKVSGGERFEYAWGAGTSIGRAPWEPATVPNLRTVSCGD